MRILGFSKRWIKFDNETFTTFRFTRKDRDWEVGETVKIVYKPRSPAHFTLGVAKIIDKEPRWVKPEIEEDIPQITDQEALLDGLQNKDTMIFWMAKVYGVIRISLHPMNKLTLKWIQKGLDKSQEVC